jgi:hypothetical protein
MRLIPVRSGHILILAMVALMGAAALRFEISQHGGSGQIRPAGLPFDTAGLRVDQTNPRWLMEDSGKARYLTGPTGQFDLNPNATVSTVQDLWRNDVTGMNDYAAAFDAVVANGHNFVRLWRWETSAWGTSAQFASNTHWRVPISQMPWQLVDSWLDVRTGTEVPVGVYDLASFNQTYFDRLRAVVLSAVKKGLTPSVMLFEGNENQSKIVLCFTHPMLAGNNINGVSCDTNSDAHCEETHTLADATITSYQDAYVRKVIDALNDIDGYIYEIVNETGFDNVTWQNRVADLITQYELQDGRQSHPIWMSHWGAASRQPPSNRYLFENAHVHIVAPAGREYETNPPHNHGNKRVNVVFHDTDHAGYGNGVVTVDWPWKAFTRGISPLYLDCPHGYCRREPDSDRPLIRRAMAQTLAFANRINLKDMTVATGYKIIDSSYGLYQTCAEYLMYMPKDGRNKINLESCKPEDFFSVEYFEPKTGATISGGRVRGGATRSFDPPGSNPMVVYLKSLSDDESERYTDESG